MGKISEFNQLFVQKWVLFLANPGARFFTNHEPGIAYPGSWLVKKNEKCRYVL